MKLKLIALALSSMAAASAFADTNVQIYGTIDSTFDVIRANGGSTGVNVPTRNRVTFNSSYIGFRGTEDLGSGLKALWQVETGINENGTRDTGVDGTTGRVGGGSGSAFGTRDTYLGLSSSNYGTVILGNFSGPTRTLGTSFDVNTGATGIGSNAALLGKVGGGSGASLFDQRLSNAIAYVSPTFGGVNATIGYMANENRGLSNDTYNIHGETFGLNYSGYGFKVGYAYTGVKGTDAVGANFDARDHRVGANYTFTGGHQVGAIYDRVEVGSIDRNVYYVNGKYVIGNGALIAQYGRAGDVSGVSNSGASNFAIGYEHNLSKRTLVKVGYAQISNEANASYDFLNGSTATTANTTNGLSALPAGTDPRGFSVGIRHSF